MALKVGSPDDDVLSELFTDLEELLRKFSLIIPCSAITLFFNLLREFVVNRERDKIMYIPLICR